ncbi:outer membrane beta-barrel domain-containing protein [Sorangium sp. So ce381]|uniref:outer membrane beta-barrel domain-containing protein n=1 Tax=Sorangium sp. So ce381 TaxID=3133307 RepID=UPI003F5BE1C1
MNQARVGLLVAAALVAVPLTASAQPKGQPKEINLDEPETPAEGTEPVEAPAAPTEGGEETGLGDICKIDPTACPTINLEKEAAKDLKNETYAVQQIYALRYHRFEVNPYFGLTMNDQFVGHNGPGLAVNWYLTNVLAIGVNGNWYGALNTPSDFNFQTSRAARIGEPITEYQWNANANFTYVPAYGKFAGFSDFIFHYDFFVLGGVGAISTRPMAVVDPDNRTFDWKPKLSFHVGGGLRIFFNRWFAAMFEVSDYIFFDELENPSVAANPQDKSTWLAEGKSFTNNVQAQVGLSVFLPFSWEYRLPK